MFISLVVLFNYPAPSYRSGAGFHQGEPTSYRKYLIPCGAKHAPKSFSKTLPRLCFAGSL